MVASSKITLGTLECALQFIKSRRIFNSLSERIRLILFSRRAYCEEYGDIMIRSTAKKWVSRLIIARMMSFSWISLILLFMQIVFITLNERILSAYSHSRDPSTNKTMMTWETSVLICNPKTEQLFGKFYFQRWHDARAEIGNRLIAYSVCYNYLYKCS